ncbi:hypothetical protein [Parasphingorhabdus sp.]|uniref:hypothetical protein n=1 Tax=Parasphingorhabdus sp. TaxID=2709688 RepID=UPI003D2DBC4A
MNIYNNTPPYDNFANEVVSVKKNWEVKVWSFGLPGMIALIKAFVRDGYTDQYNLVNAVSSLSRTYSLTFVDEFIDHIVGNDPRIHLLHRTNDGSLVLIEDAGF